MANETYKIKIKSPLIRPGIEIETEVSKKYLGSTLSDLLNIVRGFNSVGNSGIKEFDVSKEKARLYAEIKKTREDQNV